MVENPSRGIVLMVAAAILFSLSDMLAKYLTGALPAVEIGWIRYVVFVPMALSPLARPRHASLRARRPWLQLARGRGLAGSALFFILGLNSLPMAEAATINFASPLLITVLAVLFLGAAVGLRGWLAMLPVLSALLPFAFVPPGLRQLAIAAVLGVVASAGQWLAILTYHDVSAAVLAPCSSSAAASTPAIASG